MYQPLHFRTALVKCARLFSQDINQLLLPLGLNYSLWQVLFLIQKQQICSALTLAQELGVSKPSISNRIQILLDKALIEQVSSADRRQKCLQLSSLGHDYHAICSAKIDAHEAHLLAGTDPAQQRQTLALLNQLIEKLSSTVQENQDD